MLTALERVRRSLPLASRADLMELLDGGCLSLPDVEENLADLARLNRLPGGVSASIVGVCRLIDRGGPAHVIDVGTGQADIPLAFAKEGWQVSAVDANPEVLGIARRATAQESRIVVVEADAHALPFPDDAFDVAHGSLLIHHLDPSDAISALREMRRVARRGVVINDLRRGMFPLAATAVSVMALGRSGVTRADGVASARRAYTLPELDRLLVDAGLRVTWRSTPWMPRVVTVATRIQT
ncbi:MAG: methyltransferase domain-containing protein [Candidatus Limnocylindria bacterium]